MTQKQDPIQQLSEARVGRVLNNKWHLDSLIGVGGMAAVYQATHRNGKKVAVKILHPIFPSDARIRERFLREGKLANKVEHPGTVSVIDDDTTDEGDVFLVMELLDGVALDMLLWKLGGTMQFPYVLAIAEQVLDVLVVAHAKGVIHRDLKPGNLFLTRDRRVKVLDYGFARLLDPEPGSPLTGAGTVLGTPAYMAPEQARAQWFFLDGRTDLFAVGAVMFKMLAGRNVHDAPTERERHVLAMTKQAPSLATVAPNVPKPVAALVDKALKFERDERWRDAATMQAAVRNAMVMLDVAGLSGLPVTVDSAQQASTDSSVDVSLGDLTVEDPQPLPKVVLERVPETSAYLIQDVLSRCDILAIEGADPPTRRE